MVDDGIGQRLCLAATFWGRMTGLFSRRLSNEVLLIAPCHSVHTFGMGYAIDIAFVGREGRVMESYESVPPWQLRKCPGAYAVLERRASGEDSSGSSGEDRVVGWFKKGDEIELCVTK